MVQYVPDNALYGNHQFVACIQCPFLLFKSDRGICAFPQHIGKDRLIKGSEIKRAIQQIMDHGCKKCGSVPLQPGNNVKQGELTVNFVHKTCAHGVCPP
jgi:hypothetical protein